jgi:hypothetical protein
MAPVSGRVMVLGSGAVNVELKCRCPNQTFEIYFGSFTAGIFESPAVGNITTDSNGQFGGSITTSNGRNFVSATDPRSGQFALNVAGIRTEFVTGFNN